MQEKFRLVVASSLSAFLLGFLLRVVYGRSSLVALSYDCLSILSWRNAYRLLRHGASLGTFPVMILQIQEKQKVLRIAHLGDALRRHRGLEWGMDDIERQALLGNGYRLDLVSVPGATVLRRDDGTEVARFSVWDATRQAIEQAAQEDRRTNQDQKV